MKKTFGPCCSSCWVAVFMLFAVALPTAKAQFIAFNDHAPGPGTGSNTTTWSIQTNYGVALPLRNSSSGSGLGVTLRYQTNSANVSGGGVFFAATAGNPAPGTPAYS